MIFANIFFYQKFAEHSFHIPETLQTIMLALFLTLPLSSIVLQVTRKYTKIAHFLYVIFLGIFFIILSSVSTQVGGRGGPLCNTQGEIYNTPLLADRYFGQEKEEFAYAAFKPQTIIPGISPDSFITVIPEKGFTCNQREKVDISLASNLNPLVEYVVFYIFFFVLAWIPYTFISLIVFIVRHSLNMSRKKAN